MLNPPLKAVLFDLDGTLLDTAPDFIVTLNQLADEYKIPAVTESAIRQTVSDGARALTTLLFSLSEKDEGFEERRQRLLTIYEIHMGRHCQLFSGMTSLLESINKHQLNWGIITNKPARFTEPLLKKLSLPSTPDIVICPDHVTHTKPNPEPLYLACRQLNCTPQQSIYVGDHRRDIECGNSAGSETIAVSFGYIHQDDDIQQWRATYIANHATDIWPIIQQRLTL